MKKLTKSGLVYLRQIPKARYFQLFIDGKLHRQGVRKFESREPGCMNAFYSAFSYAISHIEEPLSITWLHEIHKRAATGVRGDFGNILPGQFRNGKMQHFTVDTDRLTLSGIMGLRSNSRYQFLFTQGERASLECLANGGRKIDPIGGPVDYVVNNLTASISHCIISSYTPPFDNEEMVTKAASELVERYNKEINIAATKDQILQAIVVCARSFELLHPYSDGNGRVFVNVMLNTLLIKNGFPPATFYEPNIFDLYDDDELVQAVKDSISHTLFCIDNPSAPLYGYTPIEDDVIEEKLYAELIGHSVIDEQSDFKQHDLELREYLETTQDKKLRLHRECMFGNTINVSELISHEHLVTCAPLTASPLYKGLTPLHIACKMGHPDLVRKIIDFMPELARHKDAYQNEPLYYAIEHRQNDIALLLLDMGILPQMTSEEKTNTLYRAARHGSVELFQRLISPDFSNYDMVLHACADGNNLALTKWLVENKKIDLEAIIAKEDYLPYINSALASKSYEVANYLISQAYKNKKIDFDNAVQYHFVFEKNIFTNRETFDLLLNLCDLTSDDKEIPVDVLIDAMACSDPRDDYVSLRMLQLIPDISSSEDVGSLLCAAYSAGRLSLLKRMLNELGCDPNAYNNSGHTLLHTAALQNDTNMISYLSHLDKFDLDKMTFNKPKTNYFSFLSSSKRSEPAYSALDLAIHAGNIDAAEALLRLGAKLSDSTEQCFAKCLKNSDEMKMLIKNQFGNTL